MALIDVAHAHFVWLERDGDAPARAYFGEWIDDIPEKTGGLLDRFKAPRAFLGASSDSLPIKRNDNNLEIDVKGHGDVRFVDSSVPPREDKEKGGVTKTVYYAKAGRTGTTAKFDLELVPAAANSNTFILVFFGAPLPKAELTIIGPSKWEKPLVTDEQGRVILPTPWARRYVLEATHFDEKPGGTGEENSIAQGTSRHSRSYSKAGFAGLKSAKLQSAFDHTPSVINSDEMLVWIV